MYICTIIYQGELNWAEKEFLSLFPFSMKYIFLYLFSMSGELVSFPWGICVLQKIWAIRLLPTKRGHLQQQRLRHFDAQKPTRGHVFHHVFQYVSSKYCMKLSSACCIMSHSRFYCSRLKFVFSPVLQILTDVRRSRP